MPGGTLGTGTLGSGTLGEPNESGIPPVPAPNVTVAGSFPPDKVALRVDAPNGASARWAEDELLPSSALSDITCSDEMSGGFKDLTGTMARDPRIDYGDMGVYGDVKLYQPGGEPVWEGSMDKGALVSGDQISISPAALGYQYVLSDDNAAQFGGINSDMSQWGPPSTQRSMDLANALLSPCGAIETGFQDLGTALQAIMFKYERLAKHLCGGEMWFYGDGIDLGKLMYNFKGTGEDVFWTDVAALTSTDTYAAPAQSSNYHGKTEAVQELLQVAIAGYKYAVLSTWRSQEETELDPYTGVHRWEVPKILGRHGLTVQGVWPNVGLLAKGMLEYVITNLAQPLYADSDYVDNDQYVISQAWYSGVSLADIVNDITKYGLYDWFVYHRKRFEYRKPGTYGRFWKAYVGPSDLNEVGQDSQRLWRSITVRFQQADGSTKLAGAPGSGCRYESSELEITDPNHPAVKADRTRRDILEIQGVTTPETAITLGVRFLEEANLLNRSGSATLAGYVMDDAGIWRPAAQVRSGDYISFVDSNDPSYRKIVGKNYTHQSRSSQVDLDAPPSGMEALLERLQAGITSLGLGS